MNTLKISVKNSSDANLLIRLLRSLNFVENVEEIKNESQRGKKEQYTVLVKLLSKIKKDELFQNIEDPVQWQKSLRDEWN
jgi:hypothetical protein